ncbi:hypothetical protein BKH21_03105 [Actinomyces oris]|nr:hypothetical protein BKH21_03105 [Actinomyces oris]
MPWWLALLNSALGIMSAGFGVVAVIRPQTLDPSWDGESGERFYPAMYAARSVPLGVLVAAVVWLAPARPLTLLVLVAAAAAQLGDALIGVVHRVPGMVVFPLAVALVHLASAVCLL